MKNAFRLKSNLPPLSLPLSGGEQKRGLFKNRDSQSAFTLVELAIVLVIVGLITVGVVGGQSIMESAEKRGFVTEIQGYQTAVRAFDLEFDAIPGDFDEAEDYWGSNCNGKHQNCNGNGNGTLRPWPHETSRFWIHLEEAGIINVSRGANNWTAYRKMQNLRSADDNAIHGYMGGFGSLAQGIVRGHELNIMFVNFTQGTGVNASILKASESKYADDKMDNGDPSNGMIRTTTGASNDGDCINSDGDYNISNDGISCITALVLD
jgi:prepilin-type N-terminal cleavage/methylation domain-containing protein